MSITFDDARPSQLDLGMGILDAAGIKATFYVSPDNLRARADEWRKVAASGHEIGNHTVSHPCSGNFPWSRSNALEDYSLSRMEEEITGASDIIRNTTGTAPRTFAYPCGQTFVGRGESSASYVPLVHRHFVAGRAFPAEIPNDPSFCDLARLGAFEMDGHTADDLWHTIEDCRQTGAWTILCGHEVGRAGRQTTPTGTLADLCRRLREAEADIWTATVAEVAERIAAGRLQ